MFNNDDFDYITETDEIIRTSSLRELSDDLLKEEIKSQVINPYNANVNFLEQFLDEYNNENNIDEDSDLFRENAQIAWNFYVEILHMINDRFNLDIDFDILESLRVDVILNIVEAVYDFFIINYKNNIIYFIVNYIDNNKDLYAEASSKITNLTNKNTNIIISSLQNKLKNQYYVYILCNLNSILNNIREIEMTDDEFINYFDSDKFEVNIIKYCLDNNLINGEFVRKFINVSLVNLENDTYNDIFSHVRYILFNKYKRVDYQPEIVVINDDEEENDD